MKKGDKLKHPNAKSGEVTVIKVYRNRFVAMDANGRFFSFPRDWFSMNLLILGARIKDANSSTSRHD